MAQGGTYTFNDPDGYAAAFGDVHVKFTITGAGDFTTRLTRLKLQHLEVYRCRENLPRIAYLSLPAERTVLSFPIGSASLQFGGHALRNGDILHHSRGESLHQRSSAGCQWGLVSLSAEQLATSRKALTGRPIGPPQVNRILRPSRAETSRFQGLFRQACRLAENRKELIEHPEIARALEQGMLHAIVHSLAADEVDSQPRARQRHAALMIRFEEALSEWSDKRLTMPELCAEIDVAERTLRVCCTEFLGVSPTRYALLLRLNRVRSALRRADSLTVSVAEIARNHHFLELGRFAVRYRAIFGESPSTTLQRHPQKRAQSAEFA